MRERTPFDPRTATWIYVVGIASLVCATALSVLDVSPAGRASAGADSFSRSAIGHRAFVDLLRRLDVPVIVSENASAEKAAAPGSVLLVAEPDTAAEEGELLDDLLDAPAALLVLPKRAGRPSARRRGWLGSATLLPAERAEAVLGHVVGDGGVVRPSGEVVFEPGPLEATPSLASPQLIRSDQLERLVWNREGMLAGLARFGTQRIVVLSDPDLIASHAIGRGENALVAVRLVETLLGPDGVVIVDETAHGYRRESPSLWRELFELPLLAATVQVALATLVVLWSASVRFGAPVPLEPEIQPGKGALIDSTAALLDYGGHGAEVVRRYLRASLRDVARRLHAPRLDDAALWAWLTQLGEARGAPLDVAALMRSRPLADRRRETARSLLAVATRIHQWRTRILDGRASG